MTNGNGATIPHNLRYGKSVRVVSHAIGTAIKAEVIVTAVTRLIERNSIDRVRRRKIMSQNSEPASMLLAKIYMSGSPMDITTQSDGIHRTHIGLIRCILGINALESLRDFMPNRYLY